MTRKRALTAAAVKRIKPPEKGQVDHFDAALPGFALRVSAKGAKSYVLFYRPKIGPDAGKLRRLTMGTAAEWSLADARDEAREWKRRIEKGEDPKDVMARQHTEALDRAENTFGKITSDFIRKHAKRNNKSWAQAERIFELHVLPEWRHRPIDGITRRDVIELLDEIVESGRPVLANRVLAHVRKLFNWCLERGVLDTTPVAQVKAPGGKELPRDRELSDHEIKALWPAFDTAGYPFGPMMKLLLVTGQRRGEVATMRWPDLDVEEKVWNLPREATKSARAHSVPLSPLALEIIEGLPRFSGPHVFSTKGGERPVSGYSRAKQRVEKAVNETRKADGLDPLPDWRLHDLRRSAASGMARLGIPSDHLGRVLNHVPQGVTARVYDKHVYLPEKRRALEAWASYLESLFRPADSKVVRLRREEGTV